MRTRAFRHLVASSWLALVACTGGQTGDEGPRGRSGDGQPTEAGTTGADFIDSLRPTFGNYDAARSVEALADRSARIAVGTIAAVRKGRRLDANDPEATTAVLDLTVSEVLKGESAAHLYIELYVGFNFDAANVPDPLPENRVLFFLIPAANMLTSAADAAVIASIPGVPDGETLYSPTTPQGLMVETASGSVDSVDLVVSGTFDELLDRVRE